MLASHQRSHSISSPLSTSFSSPPVIPLARPSSKTRRPSLTNHMSRFKDSLKERIQENVQAVHGHVHRRAQSNGSSRSNTDGPYEQRGVYISEPQLTSSADSLPSTRLAPLGSGAIVVGTPQEALALSAQRGGYRGPLAAASAPSHINQLPKQHPAPVQEEEESECEEMEKNLPRTPRTPVSASSRPTSPMSHSRGFPQSQQRDRSFPRRSGESNASSQASGSRGLGPALPDRRSQGSAKSGQRNSPLGHSNAQLHVDSQARSMPLTRPKSDPEHLSTSAASSENEMQVQRKSGTDIDPSRPKTHFSSYSDPGCHIESDCFAAAPQLPVDLASALPQPVFEPILMSSLPANMHKLDPGKVIVVLETGDASMKSTLKTLTSRPSYLATYLNELVVSTTSNSSAQMPMDDNRDSSSVYSQHSEFEDSEAEENYTGFNSLFQDHLKSTGIIKIRKPKRKADVTSLIHVFLDRPSAPYAHIIAYLRAPILSSHPEGMLPYAARLFPAARHSFATARLEALLDLRDEAAYLGLTDLMRLCDEELAGQVPLVADGGRSSIHSTHTLCDSTAGATTGSKEKSGTGSAGNSPPVLSVDIPVVLPTHESQVVVPPSAGVNKTASTDSKREKRDADLLTKVPNQQQRTNKILNASQLRAQGIAKPTGNYF
ncbi:hypothetical protein ACEPAH_4957 [Sanghuangporus vaninii]